MTGRPLLDRSSFIRWTVTVTAAESAGFVAPAVVGALTTDLPWYAALPALLAAGAVEGAVLGWAQASVLRRVLPTVRGRRWVMLTAGAAVAAYVLATVAVLAATASGWVRIVVPVVCGALLLISIGGAQWLELRHHVARAASWVPATALAWLLALGAFLAIASPLWHEGQRLWVTVLIGVGAGVVMAFVQAALTGWWLLRLLLPSWQSGRGA
ncbi:hypothetical protein ACIA03_09200 [Nocardioides sp. NPDC051685]|uniref:hypothetical protein n=1 Tax=Nocardioides sp. NPDC051685 TaxID=3364334 RepID=UPI0037BDD729